MPSERSRSGKYAIALAACSVAWVIGSTLFFGSGELNPAGLVPSLGTLLALWGSVRSDRGLMAVGTAVVVISSAAFVFSLGFTVVPAAVGLIVGTLLLAQDGRSPA